MAHLSCTSEDLLISRDAHRPRRDPLHHVLVPTCISWDRRGVRRVFLTTLSFANLRAHYQQHVPTLIIRRAIGDSDCCVWCQLDGQPFPPTIVPFGRAHSVSFGVASSGLRTSFERCLATVLDWIGAYYVVSGKRSSPYSLADPWMGWVRQCGRKHVQFSG